MLKIPNTSRGLSVSPACTKIKLRCPHGLDILKTRSGCVGSIFAMLDLCLHPQGHTTSCRRPRLLIPVIRTIYLLSDNPYLIKTGDGLCFSPTIMWHHPSPNKFLTSSFRPRDLAAEIQYDGQQLEGQTWRLSLLLPQIDGLSHHTFSATNNWTLDHCTTSQRESSCPPHRKSSGPVRWSLYTLLDASSWQGGLHNALLVANRLCQRPPLLVCFNWFVVETHYRVAVTKLVAP